MRSEFVELIEDLEKQAKERLEEARGEADKIRDEAHREAQKIVRDAREKSRIKGSGQASAAETEPAEVVLDEETVRIRDAALNRRDQAVSAILKAVEV